MDSNLDKTKNNSDRYNERVPEIFHPDDLEQFGIVNGTKLMIEKEYSDGEGFTEPHLHETYKVLSMVDVYMPEQVALLKGIIICDRPNSTIYNGRFPQCGSIVRVGRSIIVPNKEIGFWIALTNHGASLEERHRIKGFSNYAGNIANGLFYGLSRNNYLAEKPRGYHTTINNMYRSWIKEFQWYDLSRNKTFWNIVRNHGWYINEDGYWTDRINVYGKRWITFSPDTATDPLQLVDPSLHISDHFVSFLNGNIDAQSRYLGQFLSMKKRKIYHDQ